MEFIHILDQIDQKVFLFLNGLHSSFFDPIMWEVSKKTIWIPFYLILVLFMVWKRKKSVWITLIALAIMVVLSDQGADLIKDTVQRFRPTHNPAIEHLVHVLTAPDGKEYRGGAFGFVSSHASNSFAVAAFTSLFFAQRWFTCFIFFWALLITYSRIYLGVHYPLDVICGATLGFLVGLVMFYAECWGQRKVGDKKAK